MTAPRFSLMPSISEMSARALGKHSRGDLAGAEQDYRSVLKIAPNDVTSLHMLGVLRGQLGEWSEAIELIQAASQINGRSTVVWRNLAVVLMSAGRHREAGDCFGQILQLQPGDVEALCARARLAYDEADMVGALADLDAALAIVPGNADILVDRGNALWALGERHKALASFDAAIANAPHHVDALNNRGNLLSELCRYDEALADYDSAVRINPTLTQTWTNQGLALLYLGRLEESLACQDRALAIDPLMATAWSNRGEALRALGRLEDAEASVTRALTINPSEIAGLQLSGKLACELGRIADGFERLTQAAKLTYGPRLSGGVRLKGPTINKLETSGAEQDWLATSPKNVVIDDFLTTEALDGLRRFCLESDIWRSNYGPGYVGAFPESGVACPLLAQIAEELRDNYRAIFGQHQLRYAWAFKYDSAGAGTRVHADDAAINVNFWITPDSANLDPESGGLTFWDLAAPPDWDYEAFNVQESAIEDFLRAGNARATKVPYRCNRAVIFDSSLFHATDEFRFRDGEANRRINVTLLFGRRSGA